MEHALLAAVAADRGDDVDPGALFADDHNVRAVGQPLAMTHFGIDDGYRQLRRLARGFTRVRGAADDEPHRSSRALARPVEQQPLAFRRPAWPADLGAASQKTDAP